jgi:hypothetical protein
VPSLLVPSLLVPVPVPVPVLPGAARMLLGCCATPKIVHLDDREAKIRL